MRLVHPLVAEVLGEFIYPVVSSHDQSLEVEFVGDSQIERDVQRVVVGDERTGGRASRYALQDRGLHFEAAGLVEVPSHRGDDFRPLDEHLPDLGIDDEVHVSLAVAEFRVGDRIEHLTVHLLHYRKHFQRFAQQGEFLGVHAELACLGDEGEALDPHYVADVEELLPDGVVHRLVLEGADFIALDVYLYPAGAVLQLPEGGCAHYPAAHKPARYAHFLEVALVGVIFRGNLRGGGIDGVFCCRIRLYAQFPELRERLSA